MQQGQSRPLKAGVVLAVRLLSYALVTRQLSRQNHAAPNIEEKPVLAVSSFRRGKRWTEAQSQIPALFPTQGI